MFRNKYLKNKTDENKKKVYKATKLLCLTTKRLKREY